MKSSELVESEEQLLTAIVEIIKKHIDPEKIILFGSRASVSGKKYSDFDIAVEGADMSLRNERLVKEALDERLGIYSIDLIFIERIDDEFRSLIHNSGKIIYEA